MRKPNIDYKKAKRQTKLLVRKGLTKLEASKITGVSYASVIWWTRDIKGRRGNSGIRGTTLKFLKEIVSKGYMFPGGCSQAHMAYYTLTKYFPVKRVKVRETVVFFLEGNERKAMEALLKMLKIRSVGYGELGYVRKAFGIKRLKRDNKIRERLFK